MRFGYLIYIDGVISVRCMGTQKKYNSWLNVSNNKVLCPSAVSVLFWSQIIETFYEM